MKTLKICLGILCLLPFQAIGTPQSIGANFFMKTITINSQKHGIHTVLVDDEDFELVNKFSWYISVRSKTNYAYNKSKKLSISMHRLIMGVGSNIVIDHINGNGLDNRKINLRHCSQSNNTKNKRLGSNNTTGYKGVNYYKAYSKYAAEINNNRKKIFLGYFDSPIEAAKAYNEAAIKYHGEFARLNNINNV